MYPDYVTISDAIKLEKQIIGAVLLNPKLIERVESELERCGREFIDRRNNAIFSILVDVYNQTGGLDALDLINALSGSGKHSLIGGVDGILDCAMSTVAEWHDAPNCFMFDLLDEDEYFLEKHSEVIREQLAEEFRVVGAAQ